MSARTHEGVVSGSGHVFFLLTGAGCILLCVYFIDVLESVHESRLLHFLEF